MALNIQRYIQYCMGEAYVDSRSYERDAANERSVARSTRVQSDAMDARQFRQGVLNQDQIGYTRAQAQPAPTTLAQFLAAPFTQGFRALGQVFNSLLTQLINANQRNASQLAQQQQQGQQSMSAFFSQGLATAAERVLGFFFGLKTHRIEESRDREEADYVDPENEAQTMRVVEGTFGSSNSGGGQ